MKADKGEFVVHRIMCGKNFRVDDRVVTCGGSYNGAPLCSTGDIQREMDKRLSKLKPSNASGKPTDAAGGRSA